MSRGIRTVHRWLGITFMATVALSLVALIQPEALSWVFTLPLLPIVLLMLSGLYLFVLPYRRGGRGRTAR